MCLCLSLSFPRSCPHCSLPLSNVLLFLSVSLPVTDCCSLERRLPSLFLMLFPLSIFLYIPDNVCGSLVYLLSITLSVSIILLFPVPLGFSPCVSLFVSHCSCSFLNPLIFVPLPLRFVSPCVKFSLYTLSACFFPLLSETPLLVTLSCLCDLQHLRCSGSLSSACT